MVFGLALLMLECNCPVDSTGSQPMIYWRMSNLFKQIVLLCQNQEQEPRMPRGHMGIKVH